MITAIIEACIYCNHNKQCVPYTIYTIIKINNIFYQIVSTRTVNMPPPSRYHGGTEYKDLTAEEWEQFWKSEKHFFHKDCVNE